MVNDAKILAINYILNMALQQIYFQNMVNFVKKRKII